MTKPRVPSSSLQGGLWLVAFDAESSDGQPGFLNHEQNVLFSEKTIQSSPQGCRVPDLRSQPFLSQAFSTIVNGDNSCSVDSLTS